MTKEEFIQNAALVILTTSQKSPEFIASYARRLADAVYDEDNEDGDKEPTSFEDEPISNVITEIDRIDEEDVRKRRNEAVEKGYTGYHPQKKGYAFRLESSFEYLEIKTVGDLLSLGRKGLYRSRNIGTKCVDIIADALYNLYEIRF